MSREIGVVVLAAVTCPPGHVMFTFALPGCLVARAAVGTDRVTAAFCTQILSAMSNVS